MKIGFQGFRKIRTESERNPKAAKNLGFLYASELMHHMRFVVALLAAGGDTLA